MYRMTPRMMQRLTGDLTKYHDLFNGGRCSGWELEELIVKAVQSDTQAQHNVFWKEAGHDDEADITVRTNGSTFPLQIKSGQIKKEKLQLSGHRLGRFNGDFAAITRYLNANSANIIAIPYRQIDNEQGRQHVYSVCYIDVRLLQGLQASQWTQSGARHIQTNQHGVAFSISPSMSWQIWWTIPAALMDQTPEFTIA